MEDKAAICRCSKWATYMVGGDYYCKECFTKLPLAATAINACYQINPNNPQVAAEAVVELYEACKAMHEVLGSIPVHDYTMEQLDARALAWWAICKAEGRPEDGC